MVKKLLTHITLHICAHHMALVADIVFAKALNYVCLLYTSIINGLGGVAEFVGEDTVEVDCSDLTDYVASYDSVRKIRCLLYTSK